MPVSIRKKQSPAKKERRATRRPKTASVALAKISPPLLATVCERKRLYKILDESSHRPVSFFTAPAGAGKTTLAASYLKSRHSPCVWLQLEAENADPASFVYYLRLAAQRIAPRRIASLPLLTAEYQMGLATFAKYFFEKLAQVLPANTVLVLDNYQEVGIDAALHEFLAEGLTTFPAGMRLLCLSRQAPPAALARRRAEGALALLDWDMLRFTLDETTVVAKLRCGTRALLTAMTLQELHTRTHGWAAGLMLLLESHDNTVSDSPLMEQGSQTTFDYFASEVFRRLDPSTRALLPPLAIPSAVSAAMATELSGNPLAFQQLEELVRANCFITRHALTHYQFHPLFRNFLLNELQRSVSKDDHLRLQKTAANLLVDEDQPEEAAQLFIGAADWNALSELVLENAHSLLTQGRTLTLAQWLQVLPEEIHTRTPWLSYWQGMCELMRNPPQAVQLFAKSYSAFEAQQERIGQGFSIAGAMDAILVGRGEQSQHDIWIARFEKLAAGGMSFPSADIEGHIWGVVRAIHWRRPDHPQLNAWLARIEAVWPQVRDAYTRLNLGGSLIQLLGGMGQQAKLNRWVNILEQLLESSASVTLFNAINFHFQHAYSNTFFGKLDATRQSVRKALALADATGVHLLDPLALAPAIYADLLDEDLAAADIHLARMGGWLAEIPENLDTAHYEMLLGWRAYIGGDLATARVHAESSVHITQRIGAVYPEYICRYGLAHVLSAQGDHDAACAEINRARLNASATYGPWMNYVCDMLLADMKFSRGDDEAGLRWLRSALIRGHNCGFGQPSWFRREAMARLCSHALQHNIEPEHCHTLITTHRLAPPDSANLGEHWPYPVKIYTLGSFNLVKDGQPLRFEGKPQRKPLELLKALIALGGRDVRDERLSTILWPDAAGDAAHSAFSTTLARLRKLLGSDDVIAVQDGRVSLDSRYCWLDTWALETRIAAIENAPVSAACASVLALYRGAFLEQESDAAWVLPAREKLRSRFLRFLTHEARRLSAAGHREQAATLYLQGLEIDPLIEDFYRGLMTLYKELNRRTEALAIFERCRALLAKTLGIEPGAETRALAESLRRG